MHNGRLYIISAPSGGGKTSLVNALLQAVKNLEVSISHTTRPKRSGESDGVNYYFIDEPLFTSLVAQHAFLEHAQVFGNYYGTSRNFIEEKLRLGVDVILEIDWQGAAQVRKLMPHAVSIFILPPSWETLKKRLQQRAQDDENTIKRRLIEAREEISHYSDYDYLVVNDDFAQALADLAAIVNSQRLHINAQKEQQKALLLNLLHSNSV